MSEILRRTAPLSQRAEPSPVWFRTFRERPIGRGTTRISRVPCDKAKRGCASRVPLPPGVTARRTRGVLVGRLRRPARRAGRDGFRHGRPTLAVQWGLDRLFHHPCVGPDSRPTPASSLASAAGEPYGCRHAREDHAPHGPVGVHGPEVLHRHLIRRRFHTCIPGNVRCNGSVRRDGLGPDEVGDACNHRGWGGCSLRLPRTADGLHGLADRLPGPDAALPSAHGGAVQCESTTIVVVRLPFGRARSRSTLNAPFR